MTCPQGTKPRMSAKRDCVIVLPQRLKPYLEANGYRVSRDCNNDVLLNIDGVFKEHAQHNNCYPHPNPSPQGGGEHTEYAATGGRRTGQTLIFSSATTRSTAGRLTMRSLNAV